jgi:hypothetical protein
VRDRRRAIVEAMRRIQLADKASNQKQVSCQPSGNMKALSVLAGRVGAWLVGWKRRFLFPRRNEP